MSNKRVSLAIGSGREGSTSVPVAVGLVFALHVEVGEELRAWDDRGGKCAISLTGRINGRTFYRSLHCPGAPELSAQMVAATKWLG